METKRERLEKLKQEQELKAKMEFDLIQQETEKMKKHEMLLKVRIIFLIPGSSIEDFRHYICVFFMLKSF